MCRRRKAQKGKRLKKQIDKISWHHVSSENNAADCASRGLTPLQLVNHNSWWHGPQFLHDRNFVITAENNYVTNHEVKLSIASAFTTTVNEKCLPQFSSFTKLRRVFAYVFRFVNNCKSKNKKQIGALTSNEIDYSTSFIIKQIQYEAFGDEIAILSKEKVLPTSNKLISLSPFLDNRGILRVGGRIRNSSLAYNAKHQILLPPKHAITKLIIRFMHLQCLHGGPKLTESVFRQNYWITNSQHNIKGVLHECMKCFKTNPKHMEQYMADLPATRVNIVNKPFTNTAIDYTGAFFVKLSSVRGCKTQKAYIAIFVCMATKAIHLEAVTDLTADAFIAAFRRFVSRRGTVQNIFSDNGTNFVKSNKILLENAE